MTAVRRKKVELDAATGSTRMKQRHLWIGAWRLEKVSLTGRCAVLPEPDEAAARFMDSTLFSEV